MQEEDNSNDGNECHESNNNADGVGGADVNHDEEGEHVTHTYDGDVGCGEEGELIYEKMVVATSGEHAKHNGSNTETTMATSPPTTTTEAASEAAMAAAAAAASTSYSSSGDDYVRGCNNIDSLQDQKRRVGNLLATAAANASSPPTTMSTRTPAVAPSTTESNHTEAIMLSQIAKTLGPTTSGRNDLMNNMQEGKHRIMNMATAPAPATITTSSAAKTSNATTTTSSTQPAATATRRSQTVGEEATATGVSSSLSQQLTQSLATGRVQRIQSQPGPVWVTRNRRTTTYAETMEHQNEVEEEAENSFYEDEGRNNDDGIQSTSDPQDDAFVTTDNGVVQIESSMMPLPTLPIQALTTQQLEDEYRQRILSQNPETSITTAQNVTILPSLSSENDEGHQTRIRKRRNQLYFIIISGLLCVCVLAILIGRKVLSSRGDESDAGDNIGGTNNNVDSNVPPATQSPTPNPTLSPFQMEWLDYFISQSFDNGTSLQDVTSPQYQSFLWITTGINETWATDNNLSPLSLAYLYHPLVPSYELLRFYAYGTFYFSTNGNKWNKNSGWMDDVNSKTTNISSWFNGYEFALFYPVSEEERLTIGPNNLDGSIPAELAHITEMLELDLQRNTLTGTIPEVLFDRMKRLRIFKVFHNELTGEIPTLIGRATDLGIIDMNENLFSSTLPTEIGNLHVLRELNLSYNSNMSGSIPTEIGRLTVLSSLGKFFQNIY